ncbi:hypothetical protein LOTGIDRAFT_238638 [Lottia gigantea]|uniref:Tetraspanin n=1 Tax=Lottia gigantea TaxID=225164 RepID=V4CE73_LOTGI|nr:hypothetical protein LOTGIDRAFT_238638 [Lottia gigantea]ESP00260.1 hypothetical protein LOTGIDRAFT_238638 [Lottia gigantea]
MCSDKVAKFLLIVLNIIFLVFGAICLGIGIWVKVDQSSLMYITRAATNNKSINIPSLIESAAYLLIGGGAIIFVIAFFGFFGAIKKIKCFLFLYAIFILVILCLEVSAAILAIVFKSTFDMYAKKYLTKALTDQYVGPYIATDSLSLAFDYAQVKFKCCGIHNSSDYSTFSTWNTTWTQSSTGTQGTAIIPFTCCISSSPDSYPTEMNTFINGMADDNCPVSQASAYTDGCYDALWTFFKTYLYVTLGIGITVAVLEFIGLVSAFVLACTTDKNKVEDMRKY